MKPRMPGNAFSFSRFRAIVRKEIIQIRRDPPSLAIGLLMPIFLTLLFGYAVNTDVDHLPMGVWDQDRSAHSRQLIRQFVVTEYYDHVYQAGSLDELQDMMDRGEIKVALVIPPDYSDHLDTGRTAHVQLIIDGTDPNTARTSLANAQLIIQHKSADIQAAEMEKTGIGPLEHPVVLEPRVLYNPEMKSLVFNIPALIGLIMQNVTAILTAFALVREKERGTMEQLIVTPVRPVELILGKLVPYVGIGILSLGLVMLTGIVWFGVAVKGSVFLLLALSLLFLVTTLSLGMLISSVAKTQLQAMQMAFAFILPSVLLSGFIFPRETMPLPIRWLSGAIPLTYFLEILRGIFLKGVGINHLWDDTLMLALITLLLCVLSVLKFKKRLD